MHALLNVLILWGLLNLFRIRFRCDVCGRFSPWVDVQYYFPEHIQCTCHRCCPENFSTRRVLLEIV